MLIFVFATVLFAAADAAPAIPEPCRLTAVAPWGAAGEGYRVQADTDGEGCAEASLTLTLVSPASRALKEWQWSATVAVRRFYGVPGPAEMQRELESWIGPAAGKPTVSSDLPDWPEGAGGPAGFEPADYMTQLTWTVMRDAALPLFCFDDAPGFQTCVTISQDDVVDDIGRLAMR